MLESEEGKLKSSHAGLCKTSILYSGETVSENTNDGGNEERNFSDNRSWAPELTLSLRSIKELFLLLFYRKNTFQ